MLEDYRDFKRVEKPRKIVAAISAMCFAASLGLAASVAPTIAKSLDFDEPYYSTPFAEPGFYNENPLKFSIETESFSQREIELIKKAVSELDEDALGITFEFCDSSNDADFVFGKAKKGYFENPFIAGYATENNENEKILISEKFAKFSTQESFKALVKHEVLHILDFDHSHDLSSIMFPILNAKSLSQKDKELLNALYPEK